MGKETHASWKNVRPSVYCEESFARFRGKYLDSFATIGYETVRSKAAYGRTISTVSTEVSVPSVNVILGF